MVTNERPIIVNEVAERTALCKEATAKAVPKLFKAKLNKIVEHLERLEGEPVGVVDI